jgi:sugar/nucleoside kinase (ribokinase family)
MTSGQSHVGKIRIQEGGCSRNVAECLGRLGLGSDVTFISAVGDDEDKSNIIRKSLTKVGIDTSLLYVKEGGRTAAFSGILNGKGEFL